MIGLVECLNFQFFMLNLALINSGLYILFSYNLIDFMQEDIGSTFDDDSTNLGFQKEMLLITASTFFKPFGIALLVVGLICASVSLLGIIGWHFMMKWVIRIHIVLLFLLLVGFAVGGWLSLQHEHGVFGVIVTEGEIKDTFQDFQGIYKDKSNDVTDTWNAVMSYYKCCGLFGYMDFQDLPDWPEKGSQFEALQTPLMCCKNKTLDYSCAQKGTASSANNWWDIGCYDRFSDIFFASFLVSLFTIFYFVILVLLLILSIYCACKNELCCCQGSKSEEAPDDAPPSKSPQEENAQDQAKEQARKDRARRSSNVDTGEFSPDEDEDEEDEDEEYSEEPTDEEEDTDVDTSNVAGYWTNKVS